MQVLFAGAELHPYVKVGGLADVMAALPRALRRAGVDVRVVVPGFTAFREGIALGRDVLVIDDFFGAGRAHVRAGDAGDGLPVYVVDCPALYDRGADPYEERGDSHVRFAAFSSAVAELARRGDGAGFEPAVLHCNDWQTGLAPLYLAHREGRRVPTVMTIHNLAYQGNYPAGFLDAMRIPREAFRMEGAEFHGRIGFLKAGLAYATKITTVSPTYAREIQTEGGGFGLEGLLAYRSHDLAGILNGIDDALYDPARPGDLPAAFDGDHLGARAEVKRALARRVGLHADDDAPVFGVVSRLAAIKGLDLVLANVDWLLELGAKLVVVGKGEPELEHRFRAAERAHPGRVATFIGFDEALARHVFGGVDVLLVPSRSEPCGLTQMYAMRYGALPLVRRTGGLADTVVDLGPETTADGTGTGFVFGPDDGWALGECIARAVRLYKNDREAFRAAQRRGMRSDLGWGPSAQKYVALYRDLG